MDEGVSETLRRQFVARCDRHTEQAMRRFQSRNEAPSLFIFFDFGDFVVLSGENEVEWAEGQGATKEPELSTVVLSRHMATQLYGTLLLGELRSVLVARNQGSGWVPVRTGSPANLRQFAELLADHPLYTATASTTLYTCRQKDNIGLVVANLETSVALVAAIKDDVALTSTSSAITAHGVGEVASVGEDMVLKMLCIESSIPYRVVPEPSNASDRLVALGGPSDSVAGTAYSALVCEHSNVFSVSPLDMTTYCALLPQDAKALHLFEDGGVRDTLNHCVTRHGAGLLTQWLRRPLLSKEAIEERQDCVEALLHAPDACVTLRDALKALPTLSALARRFVAKSIEISDLVALYNAVVALPSLYDIVSPLEPLKSLGARLGNLRRAMGNLVALVEATLDTVPVNGQFFIKPSFSPSLEEAHRSVAECETRVERAVGAIAEQLNVPREKLSVETGSLAFVKGARPLGAKAKKAGYTILDVKPGGARFYSSAFATAVADLRTAREDYGDAQQKVIQEVITVGLSFAPSVDELVAVTANLDVLTSFADVVSKSGASWCRPRVGTECIRYESLRHLLLDERLGSAVVPNDVNLDEGSRFALVTGVNSGGKTAYLRSVGVAQVLAQIGSFVPAEHAEVAILHRVLTRVGAEDAVCRGLSTFALEMVEMTAVLRACRKGTLVLVDELGRGTSESDGSSLAEAVALSLAASGCFTIFTTHYHCLAPLCERIEGATNLHVGSTMRDGVLVLDYKVSKGAADNSFGCASARALGLDDKVVRVAEMELARLEGRAGASRGPSLRDALVAFAEMGPVYKMEDVEDVIMGVRSSL